LLAPLVIGLYWKEANRTGATIAMVVGMITWIIFEAYETSWPALVPATLVSFAGMIGGSYWGRNRKIAL
ncbi:MAG TPA: sodium:solute symporter, partial [Ohtaekwangia sp.]|nr:sodium:solute symporter [Ohtaekwangia sp.]